mmetsp:Transcript_23426/g.44472  ORF Transcript_23426/g.44472 Transcript_23426/m.44472 type:complete len:239 (-) Transcript_23426:622-1338(-)
MLQTRSIIHSTPWFQPAKYCRCCKSLLQLLGTILGPIRLPLPSMLPPLHDQTPLRRRHPLHLSPGSRPPLQSRRRLLLPHWQLLSTSIHHRPRIRAQPTHAQLPRRRGGLAQRCQKPGLRGILRGRFLHRLHQEHAHPPRPHRSRTRAHVLRGVLHPIRGSARGGIHHGAHVHPARYRRGIARVAHAERDSNAGRAGVLRVGVDTHVVVGRGRGVEVVQRRVGGERASGAAVWILGVF